MIIFLIGRFYSDVDGSWSQRTEVYHSKKCSELLGRHITHRKSNLHWLMLILHSAPTLHMQILNKMSPGLTDGEGLQAEVSGVCGDQKPLQQAVIKFWSSCVLFLGGENSRTKNWGPFSQQSQAGIFLPTIIIFYYLHAPLILNCPDVISYTPPSLHPSSPSRVLRLWPW